MKTKIAEHGLRTILHVLAALIVSCARFLPLSTANNNRVLHEVAGPLAELAAGRQTLAFTVGVEQAHALAEVLKGYGVRSAAVDGSMAEEQRKQVLDDYRAGRVQIVTNAMLWTEGFDAPVTSCIGLVKPTASRALVTQMIGRGTRIAEGKSSCLVLDFVPGRMARVRLASPIDALAGAELPPLITDYVKTASASQSGDIEELLAQAREHAEQLALRDLERRKAEQDEQRRRVQSVGVIYEAPRMDVAELLAAARPRQRGNCGVPPASFKQVQVLRNAGFDVPDTLNREDASTLFTVLDKRRAAGLCTLKQAKKLRGYGLRDDVTFNEARDMLDAIAANKWRAPTTLLKNNRLRAPAA